MAEKRIETVEMRAGDVKTGFGNPRKITKKKKDELRNSIETFGDFGSFIIDCIKEDYEKHPDNTKYYIIFDQMTDWGLPNRHLQARINPDTLCQFTGIVAKDGRRIYEGDIVYMRCDGLSGYGTVEFDEGKFYINDTKRRRHYFLDNHSKYRIDGNIYDRKEEQNGKD